jgi:hypothetical protein
MVGARLVAWARWQTGGGLLHGHMFACKPLQAPSCPDQPGLPARRPPATLLGLLQAQTPSGTARTMKLVMGSAPAKAGASPVHVSRPMGHP